MIRKIGLWGGLTLFAFALVMGVWEKVLVYQLKSHMAQYGDVQVKDAQLYLDGLAIGEIGVSDRLILKNVLFADGALKRVEAMELMFDGFEDDLPVALYDDLKIKFLTITLSILDQEISLQGRLEAKQKSEGTQFYQYSFVTDHDYIRAKGVAEFEISNKKISALSLEIEKGDTRFDWLQARRVTGWFDYTQGDQTGELTIGSMEWGGQAFDNIQIGVQGEAINFAADLAGKRGQVDADLTLSDNDPVLSLTINAQDKGDFQTKLALSTIDWKTLNFKGEGQTKGRLNHNGINLDYDYDGALSRAGENITVIPNDCLNMSASLKRSGVAATLPNKACFTLKKPIVISQGGLVNPVSLSGNDISYTYKNFSKVLRGTLGTLSTTVNASKDISVSFSGVRINKNTGLVKFGSMSGRGHIGDRFRFKKLSVPVQSIRGVKTDYLLSVKAGQISLTDNTGQTVAQFDGAFKGQTYQGQGNFTLPALYLYPKVSDGMVSYQGNVAWNLSATLITGEGQLEFQNVNTQLEDLTLKNINASLQTMSIIPLKLKNKISIDSVSGQIGSMPFENGQFSLENTLLKRGQLSALGGTWSLKPFDFSESGGITLTGFDIDAALVLKDSSFQRLQVAPNKLNGVVTLSLENDQVIYKNGVARAQSGGSLSYDEKARPEFLSVGSDYYNLQQLRGILKNFTFDEFSIPLGREGVQGIYTRGFNPEYNNGKAIELDLTVQPE